MNNNVKLKQGTRSFSHLLYAIGIMEKIFPLASNTYPEVISMIWHDEY